MADRLARIFATEDDKVNCPFYHKIGACRHGDHCGRLHNKPVISLSVGLPHMYQNPFAQLLTSGTRPTRDQELLIQKEFEDFFIDVFDEVCKFGEVEEMHVCDNLADHLVGNVYVKFVQEENAFECQQALAGRWYFGRQLQPEFSPVTEFDQARCRQYDENKCNRGAYCNFMHMKKVPRDLLQDLLTHQPHYGAAAKEEEERGRRGGGGDGDRRDRDREKYRDNYEGGGREERRDRDRRDRRRSRSRSRSRSGSRDRRREREGDASSSSSRGGVVVGNAAIGAGQEVVERSKEY